MATITRDEVLARLDQGIAALTSSERWTAWLRVQARFHRYSFGNSLLIQVTCNQLLSSSWPVEAVDSVGARSSRRVSRAARREGVVQCRACCRLTVEGRVIAATVDLRRWPALEGVPEAMTWVRIQVQLGLAPRTVYAYAGALAEYIALCRRECVDVTAATREDVARYVGDLRSRPHRRGAKVVALDSGGGLANATLQQRLVAVRLFYDHLVEEGIRTTNPVGRGRYAPGRRVGSGSRGLVPRITKLPRIPSDDDWQAVLEAARCEMIRNRVMFALAYDAGLRREELCLLRSDDIDPSHRTLRIRSETTKTRRGRVVPYSETSGALLNAYLAHRRTLSSRRGLLFLSESRRNHAQPLTPWTWTKVVESIAARAGVPGFTTHTLRHLCLTDLARSGWELHEIATFAGHSNTSTTMQYVHLSGRDLAGRLINGMAHVHEWRVKTLAAALGTESDPR